MFRFVAIYVGILPLVTTYDEVKCPVITSPYVRAYTDHCPGLFTQLSSECVAEGYDYRRVKAVARFRAEVVCSFINGTEFAEMVEQARSEADLEVFVESGAVQGLLDGHIEVKLGDDARNAIEAELDSLTKETEEFTDEIKTWLFKKEDSYLRKLTGMMREELGREASPPPPTSPQTTTYMPFFHTSQDISRAQPVFTVTPYLNRRSLSPSFGDYGISPDEIAAWRCSLPVWMKRWEHNLVDNDHITLIVRYEYFIDNYCGNNYAPHLEHYPFNDYNPVTYPVTYPVTMESAKKTFTGNTREQLRITLSVVMKKCSTFTWMWAVYNNINVDPDERGWLIMTYEDTILHDTRDVFAGGDPDDKLVVVGALGSTAKPKDCTNDILGPGIYRMSSNGTCRGASLFSLRAAQVEDRCTNRMWDDTQVISLLVILSDGNSFDNCRLFERKPSTSNLMTSTYDSSTEFATTTPWPKFYTNPRETHS